MSKPESRVPVMTTTSGVPIADNQKSVVSNIAASMSGVPAFIVERQLAHFDRADRDYGERVRTALRKAGVEFC